MAAVLASFRRALLHVTLRHKGGSTASMLVCSSNSFMCAPVSSCISKHEEKRQCMASRGALALLSETALLIDACSLSSIQQACIL